MLDKNIYWLENIHSSTLNLLQTLKHPKAPGAYKYSLSSDLSPLLESPLLGPSIFALKILKMLGPAHIDVHNTINFISTFRRNNLYIDPFVYRKSLFRNFASSLKNFKFYNLANTDYIRAETRQSLSALSLFGKSPSDFLLPEKNYLNPIAFIHRLQWKNPWDAGSHFSHFMFYLNLAFHLKAVDEVTFYNLRDEAYNTLTRYYQEDGCWHIGTDDIRLKINGAMKIISGMNAAGKLVIPNPKKLIDISLEASQTSHACDNFNVIYVLKNCLELENKYRTSEILKFAENKIADFKLNYKSDSGGFSFFNNKCNQLYYGARVTSGKNCSDIHGTVLFLWGISLINKMLDLKLEIAEIGT